MQSRARPALLCACDRRRRTVNVLDPIEQLQDILTVDPERPEVLFLEVLIPTAACSYTASSNTACSYAACSYTASSCTACSYTASSK